MGKQVIFQHSLTFWDLENRDKIHKIYSIFFLPSVYGHNQSIYKSYNDTETKTFLNIQNLVRKSLCMIHYEIVQNRNQC